MLEHSRFRTFGPRRFWCIAILSHCIAGSQQHSHLEYSRFRSFHSASLGETIRNYSIQTLMRSRSRQRCLYCTRLRICSVSGRRLYCFLGALVREPSSFDHRKASSRCCSGKFPHQSSDMARTLCPRLLCTCPTFSISRSPGESTPGRKSELQVRFAWVHLLREERAAPVIAENVVNS